MKEQQIEPEHETSSRLITRRKFLYTGIMTASAAAITGCVSGIVTRKNVQISYKTIELPNLPPAFKGLTITLASDIHSSPYMSLEDMKQIAALINELKSDVILLPGDFVTTHKNELPPALEAFSVLSAPMGVFATTGNHEFYVDADLVSEGIESIGIRMMRNENFALEKEGQKLFLLGVDDVNDTDIIDYTQGRSAQHIEALYKGVPDTAATILMCHKPYKFDEFAKTNIGLMLSGHTHGGQIVFGRFGESVFCLSSMASKYVEGHYEISNGTKRTQMYVSRGLGTVALPMRFNCPPEITQITLA
ncbi:MAG: metallophosphoesterase [Bacteroidota bacterium]|nr:metallophosphoesterase [Bacteroidota bacterium]MDP4237299.1 metallophosphoesterase [Bacteroidota bacterium]